MVLAIVCTSELTDSLKFLFRQRDSWQNQLQNAYENWTRWCAAAIRKWM